MKKYRSIKLVRHGATRLNASTANSSDRIRGWSDIPLTPEGLAGVKKTAQDMKQLGIQAIVSSDLKRSVDTAKEISKTTGAPVTTTSGLRPWDLGVMTGQSTNASKPKLKYYVEHPNEKVPQGESFNSFKTRTLNTVRDIIDQSRGKKIAIVTHHRVERLLKSTCVKGQPSDRSTNTKIFLEAGEPPAGEEELLIDELAVGAGSTRAITDSLGEAMAT